MTGGLTAEGPFVGRIRKHLDGRWTIEDDLPAYWYSSLEEAAEALSALPEVIHDANVGIAKVRLVQRLLEELQVHCADSRHWRTSILTLGLAYAFRVQAPDGYSAAFTLEEERFEEGLRTVLMEQLLRWLANRQAKKSDRTPGPVV